MIQPLAELNDLLPGPEDSTATGWRRAIYDRELGYLIMQVRPGRTRTVVHYPQKGECVALIVNEETMQIEDYDPKALR